MLSKLKCHQNLNVIQTEMSPKLNCHLNRNVTKIVMSLKLKCQLKWNLKKTKNAHKIICHQNCPQNWNVTKVDCHHNLNITKTEMTLKQKYHQNWNFTKDEMSVGCLQCCADTNFTQAFDDAWGMGIGILITLRYGRWCNQNWKVTKCEISVELNCHQS